MSSICCSNPFAKRAIAQKNLDVLGFSSRNPTPGWATAGSDAWRPAFSNSMATMQLPAMGYGLRYEYGMFKQSIVDGWQHEEPDNWLRRQDPWEVPRPNETVEVRLNCSFELHEGRLRPVLGRSSTLIGIPFDRPVVGYGGKTINTLRLWAAAAPEYFDFQEFSSGDFVGALAGTLAAESLDARTLSRRLHEHGARPCASCRNIFWSPARLPISCGASAAPMPTGTCSLTRSRIQLNDTHPTLAVPELMRMLLDEAHLGWDEAWDITQRTLAYTNHTLLPEALEKWPLAWFEMMLPRHLEIIFEINRRFLDAVRDPLPGRRGARAAREPDRGRPRAQDPDGQSRHRRLAQHQWCGRNPLRAAAHDDGERPGRDVSGAVQQQDQRRHAAPLAAAGEPGARQHITEAIGDGWMTDLGQLRKLKPLAEDKAFRDAFRKAKRDRRSRSSPIGSKTSTGLTVDPDTDFRLPDQAHPRIQAPVAQRAAHHRAVQPAAGEPRPRDAAADVLLRRQGRARLSAGQADHQVHQQSGRHDRRRSGDAAAA